MIVRNTITALSISEQVDLLLQILKFIIKFGGMKFQTIEEWLNRNGTDSLMSNDLFIDLRLV